MLPALQFRGYLHADHLWKREKADYGVRGPNSEVVVALAEFDAVDVGGVGVDGLEPPELIVEHLDRAWWSGGRVKWSAPSDRLETAVGGTPAAGRQNGV